MEGEISKSKYVIASIAAGFLFGAMDAAINANPFAQKLFAVYGPIVRDSVNAPAGIIIDLVYGFAMAWLFVVLYKSLPGKNGLRKGLSFGIIAWFFRVAMAAASSWMMFDLPASLPVYSLVTGLAEMLAIGVLFGLVLKPRR